MTCPAAVAIGVAMAAAAAVSGAFNGASSVPTLTSEYWTRTSTLPASTTGRGTRATTAPSLIAPEPSGYQGMKAIASRSQYSSTGSHSRSGTL